MLPSFIYFMFIILTYIEVETSYSDATANKKQKNRKWYH